jgi:hypothetical protein
LVSKKEGGEVDIDTVDRIGPGRCGETIRVTKPGTPWASGMAKTLPATRAKLETRGPATTNDYLDGRRRDGA